MSYAENLVTVEEFTRRGWQEAPCSRRIEEIISVYKETNRYTDNFTYYHDDEGFFVWTKDEESDVSEKIHLREILDTSSYLGAVEVDVLKKLEDWFTTNSQGFALWVSPPFPGRYPDSKIISHRIAYTAGDMQKVIQNSADIFKASDTELIGILHEFFPVTLDLNDLEAIRSALIVPNADFNPEKLLSRIKEIDPNAIAVGGILDETELIKRATYISHLMDLGVSARIISSEMHRLGLVGRHSISCPRGLKTLSELIIDGLGISDRYGSLQFKCPSCKETNTRPFGVLISKCQHCGADVNCRTVE